MVIQNKQLLYCFGLSGIHDLNLNVKFNSIMASEEHLLENFKLNKVTFH